MKNVKGGGLPPETPGGDESYCASRGKGYIVCVADGGTGAATSYFYACCSTLQDAQAFCPSGYVYGCSLPVVEPIE